MRKYICILIVCAIILSLFSGCNVLQKLGLKKADNDELRPVSSVVMGEEEAKKLSDKVQVRLYFDNGDSTKLRLEIRYIPLSEAAKSVNSLASLIVKELINGPGKDSGLKATIPEGTELRSPVKIEAGVATVDFTKEFRDKHSGGKAAERMTIYSIVNTLTELKEIQKVKFLIDGKTEKEYKGNFKFDAPFPRTTSLISDEPAVSGAEKLKETSGEGDIDTDIDADIDVDGGADEIIDETFIEDYEELE